MEYNFENRPKPDQKNKESTPLYWLFLLEQHIARIEFELREIQANQMPLHGKTYVKIEEILGELPQ